MSEHAQVQAVLRQAELNCLQNVDEKNGFCQAVFDKIMCWPETAPGMLAMQPCSNHYIKSKIKGVASRFCTESGQWYVPPNGTESWTNYTGCGSFFMETTIPNVLYAHWLPIMKKITQLGYVLSITSLLIALFIFIYIKRLHCPRNKLHVHLFLSFILRASMSLLKDGLFIKGTALAMDTEYRADGEPIFVKENYSWICKALTSLRNYFITTNYMFLLMEGAYLHNLMFLNLFAESGVTVYCIIGWSVPIFTILPWIILKVKHENTYCWTKKASEMIALLFNLPIGLTVIINFILFVIIVRILSIKLTSMYMQQRKVKYQKLLKSTLVLVPLYGIPYTISFALSFWVHTNDLFEITWLFFDQSFSAFQGLFVSLVYCHLNSEVQVEIKRKYRSFKDRNRKEMKRRSRTISHTQQITLNEELVEFTCREMTKKSDYF